MAPGFTRYAPTAGPSRWLLVAGRRFVACVESTAADSIIDAVWWLADSDLATIESVVGAFPLAGADSVRSFAVAELGEPNAQGEIVVTAVVRGSAAIDVFSVGGARRFGAGGVQPWVLAEFRNVTGLVLGGDDVATGPVPRLAVGSLPIGLGVVDGERLTWSSAPIERAERTDPGRSGVSPAHTAAVDGGFDETIIRDRPRSSRLLSHHESPAESADSTEAEPVARRVPVVHELPGAIDIEEPGTATERPGPSGERDTPGSRSGTATSAAHAPVEPIEPDDLEPAVRRFAVRVGSGDSIVLDAPILVGRRPAQPRVDTGVAPRLVTVQSPEHEVSSTHVRIERSGDAVVVTDLRSTNGTVVERSRGVATRLRPGESTVVLPGTVVRIGDGNIIEITAVPAEGPKGALQPGSGADRREEGRE